MHPFTITNLTTTNLATTNLAADRYERLLADAARRRLCAQPVRRRWRARRSPPLETIGHPCSPGDSSPVPSSLVTVAP